MKNIIILLILLSLTTASVTYAEVKKTEQPKQKNRSYIMISLPNTKYDIPHVYYVESTAGATKVLKPSDDIARLNEQLTTVVKQVLDKYQPIITKNEKTLP